MIRSTRSAYGRRRLAFAMTPPFPSRPRDGPRPDVPVHERDRGLHDAGFSASPTIPRRPCPAAPHTPPKFAAKTCRANVTGGATRPGQPKAEDLRVLFKKRQANRPAPSTTSRRHIPALVSTLRNRYRLIGEGFRTRRSRGPPRPEEPVATGPRRLIASRSIGRCHAPHDAVQKLARTGVPGACRGAGTTLPRASPLAFGLCRQRDAGPGCAPGSPPSTADADWTAGPKAPPRSTSCVVRSQVALAVEVDQMGWVTGAPHLGFPGDLGEIAASSKARLRKVVTSTSGAVDWRNSVSSSLLRLRSTGP